MTAENKKIVKKYLKRYFSSSWLNENDDEFKSLVRILNKKDKQLKSKVEAISDEEIMNQAKKETDDLYEQVQFFEAIKWFKEQL